MAAKLEWKDGQLMLSGLALYLSVGASANGGHWEAFGDVSFGKLLDHCWESEEDAQQDCESEVRRLLKEAGVELD